MTLRVEWLLSMGVVVAGCSLNARVEPLRGTDGGESGGNAGAAGGGAGQSRTGTGGGTSGLGGASSGSSGAAGGAHALPCTYQGHTYQPGESFKCDCNQCQCISDNDVLSTTMACLGAGGTKQDAGPAPCTYQGHTYQPGESFKCSCNQCQCEDGDRVLSTKMACLDDAGPGHDAGPSPCTYQGRTYQPGESFKCDCNQCVCEDGSTILSTKMACPADSGAGQEAGPLSEAGSGTCDSAIHALSPKVKRGANMECSAILRLDYQSLTPLGYSIACADKTATSITETQARDIGRSAAGYPQSGSSAALVSNPANTVEGGGDELFVFVQQASDFGGDSVVHARNGLALFGASTVWAGRGEITYPTTWGGAADLGSDCIAAHPSYTFSQVVHAYSLSGGGALTGSLADAANSAMKAARETALPGALLEGTAAYLKAATVLLYPRSVGVGDPQTSEWIVVMNAGWE